MTTTAVPAEAVVPETVSLRAEADPAVCNRIGLPAGAIIVDDLPSSTPATSGSCSPTTTSGSFEFTFTADENGDLPAQTALREGSGGLNGHYWTTKTVDTPGPLATHGTWTFPASATGWGSVWVHVPALGARTSQAHYQIVNGVTGAAQDRWISQYWGSNHWFQLGYYEFAAGQQIRAYSLSAHDRAPTDFAWDAVAFAPTPKPTHSIAVIGDSYSAGEGLAPYFKDSDNQAGVIPNACHRSSRSYAYLVRLPGSNLPASKRDDVELRSAACSGATTTSLTPAALTPPGGETPSGTGWGSVQYEHGEALQVDDVGSSPAASGVLDANTSIAALTIGGNDARFVDVLQFCITNAACNAAGQTMPGDPLPLAQYEPHVVEDLLPSHLTAVYSRVHAAAPGAQIFVLGYPHLFNKACGKISGGEASWLNSMTDKLNNAAQSSVVALAGQGVHIRFVSTVDRFKGHATCDSDPWINSIIFSSSSGSGFSIPGTGSFHPTAAGQQALAEALTAAIWTASGAPAQNLDTAIPTISGSAKVNTVLTASPGKWAPTPVSFKYQWKINGVNVSGATAISFRLPGSAKGKRVSVAVTGSKSNYLTVSRTSALSAVVAAGTLTAVTPKITGTVKVGATLKAIPGTWGPAPVVLTYRWKADNVTITGANKSTWKVTAKARGKKITVTVTGAKSGFTSSSKTSPATKRIP